MKPYTIATMLLIAALTCTTAGATTHTCVDCPDCNAKIQGANYGDVVLLTADITNHDGICIEFSGKDGVTFDCGNHVISGVWNRNGYGIYLAGNSNDNTIKNCNVRDFLYGIYIFSCSNTTVQDSMFQENRHTSDLILPLCYVKIFANFSDLSFKSTFTSSRFFKNS